MYITQKRKLERYIAKIDKFLFTDKNYQYIYDDYDVNSEQNMLAKKVIEEFYTDLLTLKHQKEYVVAFHHFTYFHNLILLDNLMQKQKYIDVCNDIFSFNHYENILQARVLYGMITVFKKYF